MSAPAADEPLLEKARESLAGAEAEFAAGRYNNCANRCYYGCFQAAVVALMRAGIRPAGRDAQWAHSFVLARFSGQLVARQKLYPASMRNVLARNYDLRQLGDYRHEAVSRVEASRALARARDFLSAVDTGGRTQ